MKLNTKHNLPNTLQKAITAKSKLKDTFLGKRKWQIVIGILLIFIAYLIYPLPNPLFTDDYSQIIKDRKGETLRIFLNQNDQWCFPAESNKKAPERLKTAVIQYEDAYFYWHLGVNPVSVARAAYQNIKNRRIVSGASTLTMQLARLMQPKKRSFKNKIQEMFLAIKLDLHYSKDQIIELYLNHAPYGGNISGYRAASLRYFRKNPDELSWAQAASLAVLPNAPGIVSPSANNKQLKTKRNTLLKKLLAKSIIDTATYNLAIDEPVPSNVYPFKILAPHLTQKIHSQNSRSNIVNTTIDKKVQSHLEYLCRNHSSYLKKQGIKNCSALITETNTGQIIGYVGSASFFDYKNQGQVDGVTAARSSGSVLKPFLYALAIDEGIIIPQTLMKDVPSYFDAFSPQNADKKYNGIVRASEALVRSLNIPAVRLLNTYGVYRFYSFLKSAGLTTLFRSADDYGLPLIIGGAEVTMLDMSKLYQGLGNNGVFITPYYLQSDSLNQKNSTPQLISPAACYLTLDALKDLKRPGAEYYWQQYQNQKPIAWKTGTSYGQKDGWAIGVTPQYTIAVWAGNFDGEGNPNLSGAGSAGPLLFDIINYLTVDPKKRWFEANDYDFQDAVICRETGFLAGPNCDNRDTVKVPAFMKSMRICPYHKNVFLDKNQRHSVCSYCWKEGYINKHYLAFPADVNHELKKRGHAPEIIPSHNPNCSKIDGENPLYIIYPQNHAKIWIPRDFDNQLQQLVVKLAHDNPTKKIFWYMDDIYLGETINQTKLAISVDKGWHTIVVKDEDGYSESSRFYINVKK